MGWLFVLCCCTLLAFNACTTAQPAAAVVKQWAYFSNIVGGSSTSLCGGPTQSTCSGARAPIQARWGRTGSSQSQQSGLGYSRSFTENSMTLNSPFYVGNFSHFNYPIRSDSAASSVDLNILIYIPGITTSNITYTYTMNIDETPNSGTCVYAAYVDQPVVPCPDKITFPPNSFRSEQVFTINAIDYTFKLLGFTNATNPHADNNFYSQEDQSNQVRLLASISYACNIWCADDSFKTPISRSECVCDCSRQQCTSRQTMNSTTCACYCKPNLCQNGGTTTSTCGCDCTSVQCPTNYAPNENCTCKCAMSQAQCTQLRPGSVYSSAGCACNCPACPSGYTDTSTAAQCSCTCNANCGALGVGWARVQSPSYCGCQCTKNQSTCDTDFPGSTFNPDTCLCDCNVQCSNGFTPHAAPDICCCDCLRNQTTCDEFFPGSTFNPDTCMCDCNVQCANGFTPHAAPDICCCDCLKNQSVCDSVLPQSVFNATTCECDCNCPAPFTPSTAQGVCECLCLNCQCEAPLLPNFTTCQCECRPNELLSCPPSQVRDTTTCLCVAAAVVCGDGVVGVGEQCDPPNSGCCSPTCQWTNAPCDDNNPCTENDVCNRNTGTCSGVAVACDIPPARAECVSYAYCDPAQGGCVLAPVTDGTPCGAKCSHECRGGFCVKRAQPVTCTQSAAQCSAWLCDEATGECVLRFKPLHTPCNDSDRCTENDMCVPTPDAQSVECKGTPKVCVSSQVCYNSTCDPNTGICLDTQYPAMHSCQMHDGAEGLCDYQATCVPLLTTTTTTTEFIAIPESSTTSTTTTTTTTTAAAVAPINTEQTATGQNNAGLIGGVTAAAATAAGALAGLAYYLKRRRPQPPPGVELPPLAGAASVADNPLYTPVEGLQDNPLYSGSS